MTHTVPVQPESMSNIQLTDQLDFRSEKFNSKVLFREEGFNIILFALLEGQEIAEHQTPHNAYLQCLEGEAMVSIGGVAQQLQKGAMVHLPKAVMHGIKAMADTKLLLIK